MGQTCDHCCSGQVVETNDTIEGKALLRNSNDRRHSKLGNVGEFPEEGNDNPTKKSHEYAQEINDYSDSDYATDPSEIASDGSDNEFSISNQDNHDDDEYEKAIKGFKDAVHNGNDSLVLYFVQEHGQELLEIEFNGGENALHVAVRNCAYNLIVYLLTNGVDPNAQNSKGETPLHTAVQTRELQIVALLIKYNADPLVTNNDLQTPLIIATDFGDDDIIELLSPETQEVMMENIEIDISTQDAIADILEPHDDLDIESQEREEQEQKELEESRKIETIRIKQHNPFSKLTRKNTKRLIQNIDKLSKEKDDLPILEAWLQKQQDHVPYQWQKRWAIVKESHMLWSDIQRTIKDPKDAKARKKFNNSINLMAITEIKPVLKGKSQRKFTISVQKTATSTKPKQYLWRCSTREDRDFWVKGLTAHINHMKSMMAFLRTK